MRLSLHISCVAQYARPLSTNLGLVQFKKKAAEKSVQCHTLTAELVKFDAVPCVRLPFIASHAGRENGPSPASDPLPTASLDAHCYNILTT